MRAWLGKNFGQPVFPATGMPNLFLEIRPLLDGLGFSNKSGKRHVQRSGQRLGNIQGGIAQTPFQHPNVGRMQIGLFGQHLLRQCPFLPVLSEHQGESIGHFQTPHSGRMRRNRGREHRQLYGIQWYVLFRLPSNRESLKTYQNKNGCLLNL